MEKLARCMLTANNLRLRHAKNGSASRSRARPTWMHSNVISNANGFANAVGLSSTSTFVTDTRAMVVRVEGPLQILYPKPPQ